MTQLVLTDPLTPGDVAAVCERGRAQLEAGDADVLVCDVGALDPPGAADVDALARLALTARRMGRSIRLEGASQELQLLVDLCGLAEVLFAARGLGREPGGQPEEREQPLRVEERVDGGDPPV